MSAKPASAAHVTLIRPALVSAERSFSSPLTPPMGLGYLAGSLLAEGHRVAVVDAIALGAGRFEVDGGYRYQGLSVDETVARIPAGTDVIGISCMFTQDWPYCRRVIKAVRKRFPSTPIVAGGEHITALPEYVLRDCPELDVCALGEGERTLIELARVFAGDGSLESVSGLAYRRDGKPFRTAARGRIREVDLIPPPAWGLFPVETYLTCTNSHGVYRGRTMPILATRGCPYECTFCSSPTMYGTLWLARKPELVLDEIERYIDRYAAQNIDFYDLTMIIKKSWIIDFCRLIEKRGLRFTWQLPTGTRSEVIDREVSEALFRTGCRNVTYAPESGSRETLNRIKKRVSLESVTASIRAALASGIKVKASLIVGFPEETRRDFLKTIAYGCRLILLGVHDVTLFIFSPYPGSELFEQIRAERLQGGLDDAYFRSLVVFMDVTGESTYCRAVGAFELSAWRFFGLALFYSLSFALRPWRLFALIGNIMNDRSETILEQRAGAIIHRWISTTRSGGLSLAGPSSR